MLNMPSLKTRASRTAAIIGVTASMMVASAGLSPALAEEKAQPASQVATQAVSGIAPEDVTPEMLEEAYTQLLSSDLPRTVTGAGPTEQTTFQFIDGFELTFGRDIANAPELKPGTMQPYIGGGVDGGGMYVLLNQFDQNLVISGSGFALGAAICAVPAVGQVACIVVGAILAVATTVLAANGTSSNNRQFKVYVTKGVRSGGCV